jgi:D-amino-acid dehydrogenase
MPGGTGPRAAVVGAGIVGLSAAWFLQREGFDVTVFDRRGVGAGASAGNAGWICPAMVAPLPEPSVLRYGLASLLRPGSPLRIPPAALPRTWRFLAAFAAHCSDREWQAGVAAYAHLSDIAFSTYGMLADAGVTGGLTDTEVLVAFEDSAEAAPLRHELESIAAAGRGFGIDELVGAELRREQPLLGEQARYGLRIHGQKYLQPLEVTLELAASVTRRGGQIMTGTQVSAVRGRNGHVRVEGAGTSADFDVCVLANGAWIGQLARGAGIRVRVLAGRGYSFRVPLPEPLLRPLYLPAIRVACTPAADGMRVAGTMEFRLPDDALDRRRINAIVRSARQYLPSVWWPGLTDSWVGPRPVTADGLPIIGATNAENVFVAGGHGMWGMTLGPATGRLLAQLIATGREQAALAPFDPLR